MVCVITNNIEVSVEVVYSSQNSSPRDNHYFFIYFITITNKSDYTVQLLKRHWEIFDTGAEHRVVDGEGVVGETPLIEPGRSYTYNSACNLTSEIGYMEGFYKMQRAIDDLEFDVKIPRFELVVPSKLN
ncbi:MAG: Co2+/Mg2+ efflux protein ApaG [Bacteroidetes bacterium]|nr:Co2+/Mg2+ efflux protein ApaG [Bacteroidota bacterium]